MTDRLLVDTDVLIDFGRGVAEARDVLTQASKRYILAISTITQMEMIVGCRNKAELREVEGFVAQFEIVPPSRSVVDGAVGLLRTYSLSHGYTWPMR